MGKPPLTPWERPVPRGTAVEIKSFRFPGRDHPRIVVALVSPFDRGFKRVHLTRPVAYVQKRGVPAWIYRAIAAVTAAIDGRRTMAELYQIAEEAHQGSGIRHLPGQTDAGCCSQTGYNEVRTPSPAA